MTRTSVYTLGTPVAVLGWLLFLGPSLLIIFAFAAVYGLGMIGAVGAAAAPNAPTDAGGVVAGGIVVGALGSGLTICFVGPWLIVGLILTLTKNVIRCEGCGITGDQVAPDRR